MKKSLAVMLALIMVLCMIPTTAFAALDTGHKIDVRFTVLYVGDEFNIGYNYGTSEKTQFVCQYSKPHSDTAYNNHTIAISDIKAAADRATVNSGYQIVGWSKESNANPKVWGFNLKDPTACNKGTTIYLVAKNPNPQPTKPTKPTANDIPGIVGNDAVKVHCTNDKANHANDKSYGLMPNSYTVSEVEGNAKNGYTCTITVQSEKYVNDYNASINVNHKLDGSSTGTIKLKWNETDKKWVVDSALPVVFDVKCETQEPPTDNPPTAPKPENTSEPVFSELIGDKVVKVECTTTGANHNEKIYGLKHDSYTVGAVSGNKENGYTCEITVKPEKYVDQYNLDIEGGHKLDPESQIGKIKLKWKPDDTGDNTGSWEVVSGVPVVFDVKCGTQEPPTDTPKPPAADVIPKIVGKDAVKVLCTTNAKHAAMRCDLLENSFDIGVVTKEETSGEYFCNITVHADKYVKKYNEYLKGHTLETEGQTGTITLNWDAAGKQWKYTENKLPVTFTVMCETVPEETYYIVTYTDGVGGAAFANQVQRVKRGDPTPAFNGTPSRSGYTFTGWTPAVTDTVTDNVTYTAQWKNNDNHTPGGGNGGGHSHYYPTTTPVPVIVIPPKTGDMTIWQSILHFLGIR